MVRLTSQPPSRPCAVAVLAIVWLPALVLLAGLPAAAAERDPVAELRAQTPTSPAELSSARLERLTSAAEAVERWAAAQTLPADSPQEILASVRRLLDAKQEVGRSLEQMFALRVEFAKLPAGDQRHEQLRLYLRSASQLIDLTGRLHTAAREAIEVAAYHLDAQPQQFRRLLDLLVEKRATVGAEVMSYMLFDPPADSGAPPYTTQEKYQLLNLILATRHHDLLPYVAAFLRQEKNPSLVVIAAELIRRLGLPQKPRPGGDPDQSKPPILAEELHEILTRVSEAELPEHLVTYRRDLLAWLQGRMERGIEEDSLQLGSLELRPGDWLLMRNPSPYNLFTDLSPGLFTHVGVVAVEQGEDGIRRFVIVDLPERGARIPATPVEVFLSRTLHYVFLRHEDDEVGRQLGQAAADMIGNESQFDLQFDTSRVTALRRQTAARRADPHLLRRFLAGLHAARVAAARRVLSDHRIGGRRQHGEQPEAVGTVVRPGLPLADRSPVLAAAADRRAARAGVRSGPGSPGVDLRPFRRRHDPQDA